MLDLDKLTTSQLNRRALAIIKDQAAIDSVCFPETMSKMLILNAPTFFSASWRLIKGWLDPRTAGKIEVISSRSAGEKRLLEYIDADQLPSDYGGTAATTTDIMNSSADGVVERLETQMLYVRYVRVVLVDFTYSDPFSACSGHGSETVEVLEGESVELSVFTRSNAGATFSVSKDGKEVVAGVEVIDKDGNPDTPTQISIMPSGMVYGPTTIKVKADSKGSRFSTHNYLLVASFKK